MNMFLKLLLIFWTFFKVGLFTFGGGYSAIPLIQSEVVEDLKWISQDDFISFVGISEATPGPFAINIATFIGSNQAGILGSIVATIGFALPSFIIILLIAAVLKKFMKTKAVKGLLKGIYPVVIALIFVSGISILIKNDFNSFDDFRSFGIIVSVAIIYFVYKKTAKKKLSPIFVVLLGALLGILAY